MSQTAQELNDSDWRKDWELSGSELIHICGLVFHIQRHSAGMSVIIDSPSLIEFEQQELSKGRSADDICGFINALSSQIYPFYYEATTGQKTFFVSLH